MLGCVNWRRSGSAGRVLLLSFVLFGFLLGPNLGHAENSPGRLRGTIVVSISPLKKPVASLAGSDWKVESFLPDGLQPERFDPSPKMILGLKSAAFFVRAGLPFEGNLIRSLKQQKILGESGGLALIGNAPNEDSFAALSDHAGQDSHAHVHPLHPHPWASPLGLQKILDAFASNFSASLEVQERADFDSRVDLLSKEIAALRGAIERSLSPFQGQSFFVIHPAWTEFSEEFGIREVALERDGHEPSPRAVADFMKAFRRSGSQVLFTQPQDNQRMVKQLADDLGVRPVQFDPLSENVLKEFSNLSDALRADFSSRLDQLSQKQSSESGKNED